MRKPLSLFGLLAAVLFCCGGAANAAESRIALVRAAVVRDSSILLSDLLPDSSPDALRVSAQQILIGRLPQPGDVRLLSGGQISTLLNRTELSNKVDVPQQVVVRRAGHLIGRNEVAAAIQTALSSPTNANEKFRFVHVAPDDIRLAARVWTGQDDAHLRVTRIDIDPTIHLLSFWLVSQGDPSAMPFLAMARPEGDAADLAALEEQPLPAPQGRGSAVQAQQNPQRPVALIATGKPAQLHMVSGTRAEIFVTVTALEPGALGQRIRVKLLPTGTILYGQVTGAGQLEAEY